MKRTITFFFSLVLKIPAIILLLLCYNNCIAQNPKIKCYFNHPVNTTISTGSNAIYLNGTFDDTVAAYIDRAKYTVDIAQYNFTAYTGNIMVKVATAANAAAARGVVIRWIYDGASNNTGLTLLDTTKSIKTLGSPTTSNYGIMHDKFMIIDANSSDSNDAILMTASYDWSSTQTTSDYNNIVVLQNKPVALLYYAEFNKMWGGTGALPNRVTSVFGPYKTTSAKHIFNVNGTQVEVYFSPKDSAGQHLQNAINTVNNDLFFGIYTFTDNTIATLIKNKYNAGISVRGIMDNFSEQYNAYSTLAPVLGNNMLLYSASYVYHNKIMIIDGQSPSSDPQVFTGSFNWSGAAQTLNDENSIIIHDATVANQFYQSLCQDFASNGGTPCVSPPCPGANTLITSNITGTTYQWQVNTGTGFTNVPNNANYAGTTSVQLQLLSAPSSWYGYQYRCVVNGVNSNTTTLKFTAYWNGAYNTSWTNPVNWNCGTLPDANTDVIINSGVPYFPAVISAATCRSLSLQPGATCTVSPSASLIISH